MAEEDQQAGDETHPEEPVKKGKSKLVIIIAIIVVVLALIGGVLAFIMGGSDGEDPKASSTEVATPAPVVKKVELKESLGYLEFDPPFTLRFLDASGRYQLLRLDFALAFQPKADYPKLLSKMPEMRHEVLSAIHNFTSNELATKSGRQKLKGELLAKMRKITKPVLKGQGQIKFVLITFMVMQ
ncbi:flagellar basal body-associated protein FliL [Piscirickettsia salmonis]|uniref:Flagellar protein FliL n=1 Tax=Piscirickettsia salmonis TaxID=1238 RepID=A0A1L6TBJ2_PISSA|nr:flagellar basal body-associated FliL family protein [Piscirickettsia salmonis]AKP73873.1 flagellar basal body-associated FliL family protein [Piscirickettsia salmonis LF-89 = ATCC VR-1361]ALB22683.1 flagellar basal body-associated FliL [Piscirickettsia salmonis]ALY02693.1 flagellar basal body-associated FliL family protein [Piscirickettsia salmonis]AMA42237.1 flagellar basal body-associated FliL family protein [Piscirickettsia salmonis]AOS34712.1 flagellar basal body-associated FliL family 